MKKIILSIFLLSAFHCLKSQNINYYLEYSGSASASNIIGNEEYKYTKTGGGIWTKATIIRFPITESEVIHTNSQTISNHQVLANPVSSNATFTISPYPDNAYWTKSSNLTFVSIGTDYSCTVKASSSATSGSGWVKAVISTGTDSFITI